MGAIPSRVQRPFFFAKNFESALVVLKNFAKFCVALCDNAMRKKYLICPGQALYFNFQFLKRELASVPKNADMTAVFLNEIGGLSIGHYGDFAAAFLT